MGSPAPQTGTNIMPPTPGFMNNNFGNRIQPLTPEQERQMSRYLPPNTGGPGRPDLNSPGMISTIAQNQPQTGGYKPTQPAQPNIFQQSAGAYTDALAATRAGAAMPS